MTTYSMALSKNVRHPQRLVLEKQKELEWQFFPPYRHPIAIGIDRSAPKELLWRRNLSTLDRDLASLSTSWFSAACPSGQAGAQCHLVKETKNIVTLSGVEGRCLFVFPYR